MKKTLEIEGKILLFDFDGTLVETEILAREVIEGYFSEQGVGEGGAYAGLIIGKTWVRAVDEMQALARQRGVLLQDSETLIAEFRRRYRERFHEGVKLIPGFKELLPALKQKARFMGIVTGSDRDEVRAILTTHGIEGQFDRIWGFGDYPEGKPDPAPYLTALEEIGESMGPVIASQVLVFEDSKAGMESAHRAGLRFVQVAHESHAGEPDPRSLFVIRDWHEVLA